jgi:hypothetical protein
MSQFLQLTEPAERLGTAIIEAAKRGAFVIILPADPKPETSPLVILEGDPVDALPTMDFIIRKVK